MNRPHCVLGSRWGAAGQLLLQGLRPQGAAAGVRVGARANAAPTAPFARRRHLPPALAGMQRRRESTTFYNFKHRKLLWRVEWVFPASDPEASAAAQAQEQAAAAAAAEQQRAARHQPQRWQMQSRARPAAERAPAGAGGSSAGGGAGGGRGLVLVDARADEDRPLRQLLEVHLAYAPGQGAGARRLALRAYADAVAAAGGDAAALPVLLRQERCPVGCARLVSACLSSMLYRTPYKHARVHACTRARTACARGHIHTRTNKHPHANTNKHTHEHKQ